jgi:hypothetical protein
LSEQDKVKYAHIDMLSCSWVFAMEFHHLGLSMELVMHLPAIVTIAIALPLHQILQMIWLSRIASTLYFASLSMSIGGGGGAD